LGEHHGRLGPENDYIGGSGSRLGDDLGPLVSNVDARQPDGRLAHLGASAAA
jgi:hypothetical protein